MIPVKKKTLKKKGLVKKKKSALAESHDEAATEIDAKVEPKKSDDEDDEPAA